MKVVNLSSRPFLNRRPVTRLSTLLWVLGVLLLVTNAWLYAGHFRDSSKSQGQLAAFDRQLEEERDLLDGHVRDMRSLRLPARNERARYLNTLIRHRTFPWSALFDDIERVLPIDAYLESVQPARQQENENQRSTSARSRSRTRLTPAEARARARAQRAAQSSETTEASPAARTEPEDSAEPDEEAVTYKVLLSMKGFARNDEALIELIDNLYADESFEKPYLSSESRDRSGNLQYILKVVYLPPRPMIDEEPEELLAEQVAQPEEGAAAVSADDPSTNTEEQANAIAGAEAPTREPSSRSLAHGSELGVGEGEAPVIRAEQGSVVAEEGRASASRRPSMRERLSADEGEGREVGRDEERVGAPSSRSPSRVSVRPTRTPSRATARPAPNRQSSPPVRPGSRIVPGRPLQAAPPPSAPVEVEPPRVDSPNTNPIRPPQPLQPSASATPGARQGSLFERFFPEALRDFLAPGPSYAEPSSIYGGLEADEVSG